MLNIKILSPEADSFATLAEAEARIANAAYAHDEWDALSESGKEDCLRLAAKVISSLPLRGQKVNRLIQSDTSETGLVITPGFAPQALAFPRTTQFDRKIIPEEVKETQIDISALTLAPMMPEVSDSYAAQDAGEITALNLGPLKVGLDTPTRRSSIDFRLGDSILTVSSVMFLKMQRWLATVRGRTVHSAQEREAKAIEDRIATTTTSTTSSTSSTSTSSSSTTSSTS